MIENITIGQISAFVAFVVALYAGVKYLKKELKDAIVEMLKDQFKDVDTKLDNDNKRIKKLEDEMDFIRKAVTILIRDDQVILEHLRTENATGKIAEREDKINEFLIERD